MTRGAGSLPNFLLIGAAKAGTTSLSHYLSAHPEIQVSTPNQLNFFVSDADFDPDPYITDRGVELRLLGPNHRNWHRGLAWYRSHFDPELPLRGEASVSYTAPWYPGAAERIAAELPNVKLIFVVREPVARMVSHYRYLRVKGFERRPIDVALADPVNPYLARSRYAEIIEPYLRLFGRERIHFARSEDLLDDRREALAAIFAFLAVDPGFDSPRIERVANRAALKGRRYRILEWVREGPAGGLVHRLGPEAWWRLESAASRRRPAVKVDPAPETVAAMAAAVRPDIEALEAESGLDLSAWRR